MLIDEVHTLVGSGSAGRGGSGGGGLDIANLLKPPLARGELQVFLQILCHSVSGCAIFSHFKNNLFVQLLRTLAWWICKI